jgi:hypothetical protein
MVAGPLHHGSVLVDLAEGAVNLLGRYLVRNGPRAEQPEQVLEPLQVVSWRHATRQAPSVQRYGLCQAGFAVAGYGPQAIQGRLACRRWTGFQAIIVSASVMAGPRGFGGASRPTVGRS